MTMFVSPRTSMTLRLWTVTFLAPIWPAIFLPFKVLPGVVLLPIEPPCLKNSCVPWPPGAPENLCLLMTPAYPFPMETPVTSTKSPGLKRSIGTSLPAPYPFELFPVYPKFLQPDHRRDARLIEMTHAGLIDAGGLGDLIEADLHGVITVALYALFLYYQAGTGLHYRDRDHDAVLPEYLRHAQLLAD